MNRASSSSNRSDRDDLLAHYGSSVEAERLTTWPGALELERTREILKRHLPPVPAVVLDVGGDTGTYACWLAREGYEVHLIDPAPLHVEQAQQATRRQPEHPVTSVSLGDARRLEHADQAVDVVLLLGPLYHLTARADRLAALREARRALRAGGVMAAAIRRFASLLDGIVRGTLEDPRFAAIVERDLQDGQHRNPTDNPSYFTTAFFHEPAELRSEIEEADLHVLDIVAVEGPLWLLQDGAARSADPGWRARLLAAARAIEREPPVLGASAHVLAVARRPD